MLQLCVHEFTVNVDGAIRNFMTQLSAWSVSGVRSEVVTVRHCQLFLTIPSFPMTMKYFEIKIYSLFVASFFRKNKSAHMQRPETIGFKRSPVRAIDRSRSTWWACRWWRSYRCRDMSTWRRLVPFCADILRIWLRFMMIGRTIAMTTAGIDCTTHRKLWWSSCRLDPLEASGCPAWWSGSAKAGCSFRWSSWRDKSMGCWSIESLRSRSCCIRCLWWSPPSAVPADPCWSTACRWNRFEVLNLVSAAGESFGPQIYCNPTDGRRCHAAVWRS